MTTTTTSWRDLDELMVKEHVGMFKAANEYDIYDPETGEQVLSCREPKLGFFTKLLRFSDYKRMTPFAVEIAEATGAPVVSVRRGISIFLSKVRVFDGEEILIGGFKQKLFSIGGAFRVVDEDEQHVCSLKGKWTGWNFRFFDEDERQIAEVSKKFAGIAKEMFTTADTYLLRIDPSVPRDGKQRKLILAAVMCIDMVLKE